MDLPLLLTPEFLRFYLVLIHIMGSTLAVGTILYSYIEVLFHGHFSKKKILLEGHVVKVSLIILLLSGMGIIYIDIGFITSFQQLLTYKKLTVKLLDISILLLNGLFISYYIIPKLMSSSRLTKKTTFIFGASAGLSLACWLTAIFMGKATLLLKFLDLNEFLILYMIIIFTGSMVGALSSLLFDVRIEP